jgi:hypothetical protein
MHSPGVESNQLTRGPALRQVQCSSLRSHLHEVHGLAWNLRPNAGNNPRNPSTHVLAAPHDGSYTKPFANAVVQRNRVEFPGQRVTPHASNIADLRPIKRASCCLPIFATFRNKPISQRSESFPAKYQTTATSTRRNSQHPHNGASLQHLWPRGVWMQRLHLLHGLYFLTSAGAQFANLQDDSTRKPHHFCEDWVGCAKDVKKF